MTPPPFTDDSQVIRKYDRAASAYDRRWRRYNAATLSRIAAQVQGGPAAVILDVPCGTEELARWLLPRLPEARLIGVDGSAAMVRYAQQKWHAEPRLTFLQAMAEALPFEAQHVDWVISCNSLHYFRRPARALAEFARVLKPTGRLLLLDWCRNPWHCRLINWWKRRYDPTHVRMYTTQELERLLRETGWSVQRLERFHVGWIGGLRLWEMMEALAAPSNARRASR